MKTIKLKLYQFAELNEDAKSKALKDLYDINVSHDWYDFFYDDFVSIAQTIGVTVNRKKIYFRGFYSQGDGSAFEASVSLPDLLNGIAGQNWKSYAPQLELNLSLPDIDRRLLKLLRDNKIDCSCKIRQPGRGYNVTAVLEKDFPNNFRRYAHINQQLDRVEIWLDDIADTINYHLYKSLRDEYDYQTSEQAIIETIKANEYSFTADGKLATRIKRLAENEQQTN
jgi:hypothetical protein